MENKSDENGNVTVSISPEEQVIVTTRNNDTMTVQVTGLSDDKASIITASGDSIRIDEITDISPSTPPIKARFMSGGAAAVGGLAGAVAGGIKPSPPLSFTYINGIRVPLN